MKLDQSSILVVEDEDLISQIVVEMIEESGHQAVVASDGQTALDKIQDIRYDLVILDLHLPKIPGIRIVQEIRKKYTPIELPIIIFTGNLDPDVMVKTLEMGVNSYFTKPIQWELFFSTIKTQLTVRQLSRQLTFEKEFRDNLIQSAYEMIITVDLERNITLFNKAAERKFGYSQEEIIGENVNKIYADTFDPTFVSKSVRENGEFSGEVENVTRNGEKFFSYVYASWLKDEVGQPIGMMGLSFDITEQKKVKDEKERIAKLKSDFIDIARHDMKSPLAGIKGYADMLTQIAPVGSEVTDQVISAISRIRKLADVMQNLILDFLDFDALEDGRLKLHPRESDISQLIREVSEEYEEYARNKETIVICKTDNNNEPCMLDPARIKQVIRNLINNAIKFGFDHNEITIELLPKEKEFIIQVSDQGPGILEEELGIVFEKYTRLSNIPTAGEKSSGLGLAICKQLVELHKGEIGVRNNPERGVTFWFSIPRIKSEAEENQLREVS